METDNIAVIKARFFWGEAARSPDFSESCNSRKNWYKCS